MDSTRELSTVRRKVTMKYNKLIDDLDYLSEDDLNVELLILNDYLKRLKELDNTIFEKLLADEAVSQDNLDEINDRCEEYYTKIYTLTVKIKSRLGIEDSANQNTNNGSKRSKINLPKLQLPEYHADSKIDKFTCKRFRRCPIFSYEPN